MLLYWSLFEFNFPLFLRIIFFIFIRGDFDYFIYLYKFVFLYDYNGPSGIKLLNY